MFLINFADFLSKFIGFLPVFFVLLLSVGFE